MLPPLLPSSPPPSPLPLGPQGHWEHAGFFYRYRDFIASDILRSPEDMRRDFVLGAGGVVTHGRGALRGAPMAVAKGPVADLVVYLRLGDKVRGRCAQHTF